MSLDRRRAFVASNPIKAFVGLTGRGLLLNTIKYIIMFKINLV